MPELPYDCELLVVGAGPTGSAAAAWAAAAGRQVVLVDAATFPRDKTCGDGLTPRAVGALGELGLGPWLNDQHLVVGLRARGFGQVLDLPWPDGPFPPVGAAVDRRTLDHRLVRTAVEWGATLIEDSRAVDVRAAHGRVESVTFATPSGIREVRPGAVVVADGVRSPTGRLLGRRWSRRLPYGVAARGYVRSGRSSEPWIASDLQLRGPAGETLPGYGWVFPLGNGLVNLGVGTLATARRPSHVNLRAVLDAYRDQQRDDWDLEGPATEVASALLPMGGTVTNLAGHNWVLAGDAAGCVNPLNGEGIDYGLETGHLAADLLADTALAGGSALRAWPAELQRAYGTSFAVARRLAVLLTVPGALDVLGPIGMRSAALMEVALRVMANLVTDDQTDVVARLWRSAGRGLGRMERAPAFS